MVSTRMRPRFEMDVSAPSGDVLKRLREQLSDEELYELVEDEAGNFYNGVAASTSRNSG